MTTTSDGSGLGGQVGAEIVKGTVAGLTTGAVIGGLPGAVAGGLIGMATAGLGISSTLKQDKEQKKMAQQAKKSNEDAERMAKRAKMAADRKGPPVGGVGMMPDDHELAMSTSTGGGGAYSNWRASVYGPDTFMDQTQA